MTSFRNENYNCHEYFFLILLWIYLINFRVICHVVIPNEYNLPYWRKIWRWHQAWFDHGLFVFLCCFSPKFWVSFCVGFVYSWKKNSYIGSVPHIYTVHGSRKRDIFCSNFPRRNPEIQYYWAILSHMSISKVIWGLGIRNLIIGLS